MSQNHHGSALPPSFLPQKFQILSGSALKLIAIFVMLIDHSACILLSQYPPALTPLFVSGKTLIRLTVSAGISDGLHFLFSVFFCWKAFPIPETEKLRQKSASLCPDL